jgi:hypothetical protein
MTTKVQLQKEREKKKALVVNLKGLGAKVN